uniref:Uncharacterized protein n=1 Tax=Polytomella parva TaxID=51329 RepID=A0A7S0V2G7_9CHLO|mmetsp:Transcript_28909/g.53115  ORF Transcript_28909/g.53115 Transcript_28909/m.53115 type:complete len:263 (+) Transcript_28909:108-896(+)
MSVDTVPYEKILPAFVWEEAPDWLRKTLITTTFGAVLFTTRHALKWNRIEVFLPPRAAILPGPYKRGYIRTQKVKGIIGLASKETWTTLAITGTYYGSAYYLDEFRGSHSLVNCAAAGALTGLLSSALLPSPHKFAPRAAFFLSLVGATVGSAQSKMFELSGSEFWSNVPVGEIFSKPPPSEPAEHNPAMDTYFSIPSNKSAESSNGSNHIKESKESVADAVEKKEGDVASEAQVTEKKKNRLKSFFSYLTWWRSKKSTEKE